MRYTTLTSMQELVDFLLKEGGKHWPWEIAKSGSRPSSEADRMGTDGEIIYGREVVSEHTGRRTSVDGVWVEVVDIIIPTQIEGTALPSPTATASPIVPTIAVPTASLIASPTDTNLQILKQAKRFLKRGAVITADSLLRMLWVTTPANVQSNDYMESKRRILGFQANRSDLRIRIRDLEDVIQREKDIVRSLSSDRQRFDPHRLIQNIREIPGVASVAITGPFDSRGLCGKMIDVEITTLPVLFRSKKWFAITSPLSFMISPSRGVHLSDDSSSGGFSHPHISREGTLCLGSADVAVRGLLKNREILGAMIVICNVRRSLNEIDMYNRTWPVEGWMNQANSSCIDPIQIADTGEVTTFEEATGCRFEDAYRVGRSLGWITKELVDHPEKIRRCPACNWSVCILYNPFGNYAGILCYGCGRAASENTDRRSFCRCEALDSSKPTCLFCGAEVASLGGGHIGCLPSLVDVNDDHDDDDHDGENEDDELDEIMTHCDNCGRDVGCENCN